MSTSDRDSSGRFLPGHPGGPGRPRGAVASAAAALDREAAAAHADLMRVVLEQARAGNLEATKLLWSRVWPARRGRPVAFDLPRIESVRDVLPALTTVADRVLNGELTPEEGEAVRETIAAQQRAINSEATRRDFLELARRHGMGTRDEQEDGE